MQLPLKTDPKRSRPRQVINWILLMLGMVVPAILVISDASYWQVTSIMHSSLLMSPAIFTALMVLVGLAGLFSWVWSFRDISYIIGAIFYGLIGIAYFLAAVGGLHIGVLFLAPIVVAWFYVETSIGNSEAQTHRKEIPQDDDER